MPASKRDVNEVNRACPWPSVVVFVHVYVPSIVPVQARLPSYTPIPDYFIVPYEIGVTTTTTPQYTVESLS